VPASAEAAESAARGGARRRRAEATQRRQSVRMRARARGVTQQTGDGSGASRAAAVGVGTLGVAALAARAEAEAEPELGEAVAPSARGCMVGEGDGTNREGRATRHGDTEAAACEAGEDGGGCSGGRAGCEVTTVMGSRALDDRDEEDAEDEIVEGESAGGVAEEAEAGGVRAEEGGYAPGVEVAAGGLSVLKREPQLLGTAISEDVVAGEAEKAEGAGEAEADGGEEAAHTTRRRAVCAHTE